MGGSLKGCREGFHLGQCPQQIWHDVGKRRGGRWQPPSLLKRISWHFRAPIVGFSQSCSTPWGLGVLAWIKYIHSWGGGYRDFTKPREIKKEEGQFNSFRVKFIISVDLAHHWKCVPYMIMSKIGWRIILSI